jgi:chromosome segregation ATPase
MKKIIILTLFLCGVYAAYSQDCFDKVAKQAVVIDSLQKFIKEANNNFNDWMTTVQRIQKASSDTIKSLKSDLSDLGKYKSQKKTIDAQLQTKSDSITLLKNQLLEKDKQIATTRQQGDQKACEEREKGKAEALANIVNTYKSRQFDDLIKSSTKESVLHDRQLADNNAEIKPILSDLLIYFNAIELLAKKYDAAQIKNAQTQFNQIKQKSALLDKLKENIEYYQDFNDALKETIDKLVNLDKRKAADGDLEIQKLKFNEIVTELTTYMYNYYDYGNYPYLSDIVLEIIKRKKPNADADIKDLFNKL